MAAAFRRGLYALLATSWVSGVTFFVLNRWFEVEGEFGPQKHPWQFSVLQIHGAAAFLMLMAIGALLANHVPAGWRTHRSRWHGGSLAAAVSLMAISAWCLYYADAEEWRPVLANVHASIGFCLPPLLAFHIWRGRRRKHHSTQQADATARAANHTAGS